jgi:hypothetical protein
MIPDVTLAPCSRAADLRSGPRTRDGFCAGFGHDRGSRCAPPSALVGRQAGDAAQELACLRHVLGLIAGGFRDQRKMVVLGR